MKMVKILAACLTAAVIMLSCKKTDDSIDTRLNVADSIFILKASINNYSEIQAAQVVLAKSADSVVLSFVQYLLTEHTKAHSDLKNMGSVVNFVVKDTIDPAHATIISQLSSLTDRALDSTYIHTQLLNHTATSGFYRDELNNGSQVNVKNYANFYLQNFEADNKRADSIATAFY